MTAPLAARAALSSIADKLAAAPEAEQLALLPTSKDARIDPTEYARVVESVARRRRGRPENARNLATRDALAFVRQVLGDPLIERARDAMHTPDSLAAELGCTKLEAFDRLDKIRADLARFFYAPLAPVDDKGQAVVPQFNMLAAPGARVAVGIGAAAEPWNGPWSGHPETQQNQGFLQSPPAVSDGKASDGGAK